MCELLHTGLADTFYGNEITEQSVMVVGWSPTIALWAFPPYLTPLDSSGRGLFHSTLLMPHPHRRRRGPKPDRRRAP